MLQTEILESLQQLPDSLQEEVSHYIEFLKARYVQPSSVPEKPKKRGALGAWRGKIKIADDFDAPLEEFRDYM
jgi:mRNA-degrading endonuclease RelE of RelBE toxin-antitoxin system